MYFRFGGVRQPHLKRVQNFVAGLAGGADQKNITEFFSVGAILCCKNFQHFRRSFLCGGLLFCGPTDCGGGLFGSSARCANRWMMRKSLEPFFPREPKPGLVRGSEE